MTTQPQSAATDLRTVLAGGAPPVAVPVAAQHDLLAHLEARLTDEVRDLVDALEKFGRGTQAISKELPPTSQTAKLVTLSLGTFGLQLAYALLKDGDLPLLRDDGAQYLHKLGLRGDELFREFDVDGRRFLTIALVEQQPAQVLQDRDAGRGGSNQ